MELYRMKPKIVEAVQWLGTTESLCEMEDFLGDGPQADFTKDGVTMILDTKEGEQVVNKCDWVVKCRDSNMCLYPNGDFDVYRNEQFKLLFEDV